MNTSTSVVVSDTLTQLQAIKKELGQLRRWAWLKNVQKLIQAIICADVNLYAEYRNHSGRAVADLKEKQRQLLDLRALELFPAAAAVEGPRRVYAVPVGEVIMAVFLRGDQGKMRTFFAGNNDKGNVCGRYAARLRAGAGAWRFFQAADGKTESAFWIVV